MLRKENRLKSNRAFSATYSNNCSIFDKSIVLCIGHKKEDKSCPTRVGFVVSKKIHKRAVIRNKIKRLMREAVRLNFKANQIPNDYKSLIFIAKSNIINENYIQIRNTVDNLIKKLANK